MGLAMAQRKASPARWPDGHALPTCVQDDEGSDHSRSTWAGAAACAITWRGLLRCRAARSGTAKMVKIVVGQRRRRRHTRRVYDEETVAAMMNHARGCAARGDDDRKMGLKKARLYSPFSRNADGLFGELRASPYKDVVFTLAFMKRAPDKLDAAH